MGSNPDSYGYFWFGGLIHDEEWYVLHTYSGYENKVKKNLETRIETMGLENNVFAIEILRKP